MPSRTRNGTAKHHWKPSTVLLLDRYGDDIDPSMTMQEDYVQLPSPRKQQSADSAEGGGAIGPLPVGYPAPLSRVTVRNFKVLITLNQAEDQQQADGT